MVDKDDYKIILDKAVAELTEAQERRAAIDVERDQLDARIAELKQGILALAPLCGVIAQAKYFDLMPEYTPILPSGLKESVLAVLKSIPDDKYVTPVAIRDGLVATSYEIKSKNILPSIHNVLKRLEKANPPEVESTDLDGKTGYRIVKKEQQPAVVAGPRLRRGSIQRPLSSSPLARINALPPVPGADTPNPIRPTLYETIKKMGGVDLKTGEGSEKDKK